MTIVFCLFVLLSDMYLEEERNRINVGFYIFLFDNTHHSCRGCGDMGMRLADMDGYIFLRVLSTDGAGVLPLIPEQIF